MQSRAVTEAHFFAILARSEIAQVSLKSEIHLPGR